MPVVNKTNSRQVVRPPVNEDSVLSQAIPVGDIVSDHLKVVLYGQNRVGKTTLACRFPKPLLLISFESGPAGGAKSVKQVQGVTYLRITEPEQARRLAMELAEDHSFQTHVLDTVTSLQDLVLADMMGQDDAPVQLNWGLVSKDQYRERSERCRELIRPFRNLPAHTVFCAQEKDHNPPTDMKENTQQKLRGGLRMESFFAADLGGATVKWLHDACDYIGRLYLAKETRVESKATAVPGKPGQVVTTEREIETGRVVRRLLTMLQPNYAAGFRSENPAAVPEYIEATTPEEMYAALLAVINGERTDKGRYL